MEWCEPALPATSELMEKPYSVVLAGSIIVSEQPNGPAAVRPYRKLPMLNRFEAVGGDVMALISSRPTYVIARCLGQDAPLIVGDYGAEYLSNAKVDRFLSAPKLPRELIELVHKFFDHSSLFVVGDRDHIIRVRAAGEDSLSNFVRDVMTQVAGDVSDSYYLVERSSVWELVPRCLDKGRALQSLMMMGDFLGRRPIFVGADVSDLPAIETASRLGGYGIRINLDNGEAEFDDLFEFIGQLIASGGQDKRKRPESCKEETTSPL